MRWDEGIEHWIGSKHWIVEGNVARAMNGTCTEIQGKETFEKVMSKRQSDAKIITVERRTQSLLLDSNRQEDC